MRYFHTRHAPADLTPSERLLLQAVRHHMTHSLGNHYQRELQRGDVVFNFGDSHFNPPSSVTVINPKETVAKMVDKVKFYRGAPAHLVPTYTENVLTAQHWQGDGTTVVAHIDPCGARGEGVVFVAPEDSLPEAPLYTKKMEGVEEYRAIVVAGDVVYGSKRHDVRFENSIVLPEHVIYAAGTVARSMGLTFCGLDVLDLGGEMAVVLEANSAPLITYSVAVAVAPHLAALLDQF